VQSVAFSPDGQTLASSNAGIKLWDVSTGQCLKTLQEHTSGVQSALGMARPWLVVVMPESSYGMSRMVSALELYWI